MQNLLECETHRKERPNNAIIRANQGGGGGKLPFLAASLATLALFAVVAMSVTLLGDTPLVSAQPSQKVAQISAGGDHTCALLESGTLICWGRNDFGQTEPPDAVFRRVEAGNAFTCGVANQDEILCFGLNSSGQATPLPIPHSSIISGSVSVSTANTSACGAYSYAWGVVAYSLFACWGERSHAHYERLGEWRTKDFLASDLAVGVGERHYCIRDVPGHITCHGGNEFGQTEVPSGEFRYLSSGENYNCALTESGSISCWGRNQFGQTTATEGTYVNVSAGFQHTCGVDISGAIRCWGRNNHGQTDSPRGTDWKMATAGGSHSCAVDDDGKVACWGRNNYRQLEVPTGIAATQPIVRHKVSATASPAAGGTVSGHGDLLEGSTATLTATPAEGYRFVRWVGDADSNAATVRLRVDSDKTAIAVFELASGTDDTAMLGDGAMSIAFPIGRIVARRLDDGRTEFGYQPQGGERVLPAQRYFPANATVDRWLSSSAVIVDGEEVGQINARLLDDGRIEFAFTPTNGERILPSSRFFPVSSGGNWLRSSLLE